MTQTHWHTDTHRGKRKNKPKWSVSASMMMSDHVEGLRLLATTCFPHYMLLPAICLETWIDLPWTMSKGFADCVLSWAHSHSTVSKFAFGDVLQNLQARSLQAAYCSSRFLWWIPLLTLRARILLPAMTRIHLFVGSAKRSLWLKPENIDCKITATNAAADPDQ